MGLLDKIKNFGSRIIKPIVKPHFDWHKLPMIKPIKPIGPIGPGGIPRIKPTPEQAEKNRKLLSPGILPVLKKPEDVQAKPDFSKGKGVKALTPEQTQKIKEAIAKGRFKFSK